MGFIAHIGSTYTESVCSRWRIRMLQSSSPHTWSLEPVGLHGMLAQKSLSFVTPCRHALPDPRFQSLAHEKSCWVIKSWAAHKHAGQVRRGPLVGPHAPVMEIQAVVEKNAFPSKSSPPAQRSQSWYMHRPGSGPTIPWPCLLILLRVDLGSVEQSLLWGREKTHKTFSGAWLSDLWPCSLLHAQFPEDSLHKGSWLQPCFIITLPSLLHFHPALTAAGSQILDCRSRRWGFTKTRKVSVTRNMQHLPGLHTCGFGREIKCNSTPKFSHPI